MAKQLGSTRKGTLNFAASSVFTARNMRAKGIFFKIHIKHLQIVITY